MISGRKRGRDKFHKYKKIILLLCKFYSLFPRKIREKMFERSRNISGYWGLVKRYTLLHTLAKCVGDNVAIYPGVVLKNCSGLSIGDNVSIHSFSYIDAIGQISIGNDVSIATKTTIISHEHIYEDTSIPIKDQGLKKLRIVIEDNVWIGANVTILGGTTIQSGTIIGAMSLVNRDIGTNIIAAGIPAREIKTRFDKPRY